MKLLFILLFFSFSPSTIPVTEVTPEDVKNHIGERVKVCGKIVDARFFESAARQTVISMGSGNPPLNVVISNDDRRNFTYKPEIFLKNKTVCITGRVVDNNGRTELILSRQDDIRIDDDENDVEVKANFFDFFNKYFDDRE